jgi:hypothetical protein
VLALDLVEQRRGKLVLAAVEAVLRGAIERIHVARDVARVLLDPTPAGAGREQRRNHEGGGDQAHGGARGRALSHGRGIATAQMNAK